MSFSSQKLRQFIVSLEEYSKWNYSGETVWLDRMVKEEVIYSPGIVNVSDKLAFKQIGTVITNLIKDAVPFNGLNCNPIILIIFMELLPIIT